MQLEFHHGLLPYGSAEQVDCHARAGGVANQL